MAANVTTFTSCEALQARLAKLKSHQRAVVMVGASWGPASKRISSHFLNLSILNVGEPNLFFFDIDVATEERTDGNGVEQQYNVHAFPCFLWFKKQEKLGDFFGGSRSRLDQIIDSLVTELRAEPDVP